MTIPWAGDEGKGETLLCVFKGQPTLLLCELMGIEWGPRVRVLSWLLGASQGGDGSLRRSHALPSGRVRRRNLSVAG